MTVKNAFSAFGFEADEATIDTLRTDLAFALRNYIEKSGKNQARVGQELGLKQSVVSHIVRGDIAHLSVERLIKAMVRAGIPGFAEWAASPERARACAGLRAQLGFSTAVQYVSGAGLMAGTKWEGAKPKNQGEPVQVVSESEASPAASSPT